jgi:hypothetical protein
MPLEAMPPMLVEAFIAAEDSRFYEHGGIDFISILRAFFKNLEAGDHRPGRQHHHPAGHQILFSDTRKQLQAQA